jgi:hypothetical protein
VPMTTRRAIQVVLSVLMAAAVLMGGIVHLKLYNDGYKDIPIGNIGKQFLLNFIAAVVIAAGLLVPLVVRTRLLAWIGLGAAAGGVVWAAISLIAFKLARTDTGWFNFYDEPGLNPSPEAALAVFSEAATVVLGLALVGLTLAWWPRRR